MAEFPALPVFTDAFISDTTHLTAAQTGAYFMLLMMAWRTKGNCLPDDDGKLARWARMDMRTWKIHKHAVMAFWHKDASQNWRQGRLDDERKRADDMRIKNAEAGRSSALKRKGRHSTSVQPNFNESSTPSPSPSPIVSITNVIDSPPTPSEEKPKGIKNAKRKPTTHINEEFEPDISGINLCTDFGINCQQLTREFIDYWKGTGEVRADWQATFRNRVRQIEKYRIERESRNSNQRSGIRDVTGAALRVAALRSGEKA